MENKMFQQIAQVMFFLSMLVLPFGILLSSSTAKMGKKGLENAIDSIVWVFWLLGTICSIWAIPYSVYTSVKVFISTQPEWYSYDFGTFVITWMMLAFMMFMIFVPTKNIVTWLIAKNKS